MQMRPSSVIQLLGLGIKRTSSPIIFSTPPAHFPHAKSYSLIALSISTALIRRPSCSYSPAQRPTSAMNPYSTNPMLMDEQDPPGMHQTDAAG